MLFFKKKVSEKFRGGSFTQIRIEDSGLDWTYFNLLDLSLTPVLWCSMSKKIDF